MYIIAKLGLILAAIFSVAIVAKVLKNLRFKKEIGSLGLNAESELKNAARVSKIIQTAAWVLDPCETCGSSFFHIQKVDKDGIFTFCDKCGNEPNHPLYINLNNDGREETFQNMFLRHLNFIELIHKSARPKLEMYLMSKYFWSSNTKATGLIAIKVYGNSVAKILRKKGLLRPVTTS